MTYFAYIEIVSTGQARSYQWGEYATYELALAAADAYIANVKTQLVLNALVNTFVKFTSPLGASGGYLYLAPKQVVSFFVHAGTDG